MVREHQIRTAAVNVEMVAQLFAVHRGTFNVPARTPFAPRGWPARFARLGHLPQHEVHRITLHVNHVHACTGLELVQILAGKRTVGWVRRHREHHVAVVRHIGVTALDQLLGDLNDFMNMVGRTRLAIRAQNIQGIKILVHFGDHAIHQRDKAFAIFISTFNDFVVDVGDVAHILQVIAQEAQVAGHHVERDKGTAMADMTEIVNRNTTHVHADFPGMDRFKFLFLARHCIKDF